MYCGFNIWNESRNVGLYECQKAKDCDNMYTEQNK